MNNKKLIGYISLILGIAIFIVSLIYYIKSFGGEDYGDAKEFWADSDFLVFMIVGLIYSIYGLNTIVKYNDDNYNFVKVSFIILLLTGFIDFTYCYGKFFESLSKGKGFDTWYFLMGLVGALVSGFGILIYHLNKNNNGKIKAA